VTVKNGGTIRFIKSTGNVAVRLKTACASGRLWVNVHAQEFELESIEMRDVRDEVHEIRKLKIVSVIVS
jgi:hypothetical protein